MNALTAKRLFLDMSLLEAAGIALGIGIGVITSSYQAPLDSSVDVSRYQNFGIMCGAVVGLGASSLGSIVYAATIRLLHQDYFRAKRYLIGCSLSGAVAAAVTFLVVNASGPSYGMVLREMRPVATDAVVSAIIGSIVGLSAGWVVSKVRGFE